MRIAIGSDGAGFELKEEMKAFLADEGHDVEDLGTLDQQEEVKFMYAAHNVALAVQSGRAERGIVFCGTGAGVSIVANKHKGIYCAVVESEWTARNARFINNANVLALGGRILAPFVTRDIIRAFLSTEFHENVDEKREAVLEGLYREVAALEETLF